MYVMSQIVACCHTPLYSPVKVHFENTSMLFNNIFNTLISISGCKEYSIGIIAVENVSQNSFSFLKIREAAEKIGIFCKLEIFEKGEEFKSMKIVNECVKSGSALVGIAINFVVNSEKNLKSANEIRNCDGKTVFLKNTVGVTSYLFCRKEARPDLPFLGTFVNFISEFGDCVENLSIKNDQIAIFYCNKNVEGIICENSFAFDYVKFLVFHNKAKNETQNILNCEKNGKRVYFLNFSGGYKIASFEKNFYLNF